MRHRDFTKIIFSLTGNIIEPFEDINGAPVVLWVVLSYEGHLLLPEDGHGRIKVELIEEELFFHTMAMVFIYLLLSCKLIARCRTNDGEFFCLLLTFRDKCLR